MLKKRTMLELAKNLVSNTSSENWLLCSQRYWLVQQIQEDIRQLESKEIDLITELDSTIKIEQDLETVMRRQSTLRKQKKMQRLEQNSDNKNVHNRNTSSKKRKGSDSVTPTPTTTSS